MQGTESAILSEWAVSLRIEELLKTNAVAIVLGYRL
jgi:hypothetical protein